MNRLRFAILALTVCEAVTPITQAQERQGGFRAYQSNQIGSNALVSSPSGSVYLILNNGLFHNIRDSWDSWDRIAPNLIAVALDPRNEQVLYAIDGQNHILKSPDGGKQWLTLNTGLPASLLSTIYVNPANPQEVLVGGTNGLIKTADGGFSWRATSFAAVVNQIVIDPRADAHRYLLSAGSIFASSDGGNSWKKSETGLPSDLVRGAGRTATKVTARVSLLVLVEGDKPYVLAATVGKGVLRSDDRGASWNSAGAGLDPAETFTAASVGKQGVVLASSDHLYRSTDGMNWSMIAVKSGRNTPVSYLGVIEHPNGSGLLVQFRFPQDGQIENVGAQKRVGYLDANGVLIGLNYGVLHHSQVDNVWASSINGAPALFAMTANLDYLDQAESAHRPVFTYLSTDNGYSWELLGRPECGESMTRAKGYPSDGWLYGNASCLARTGDGGRNWGHLPGLDTHLGFGTMASLVVDPKNHHIAYFSARVIGDPSLYRYQYNPETRQGQSVDLKTLATGVVVDETNSSALFTDIAQLSTDGGWTWVDRSKSLAATCKCAQAGARYFGPVKLLSFRGGEIRTLIAYKGNAFNGYPGDIAVVRSEDSGATWSIVSKLELHGLLAGPFVNPDDASNAFIAALTAPKPKGNPGAFGASYRADAVKVLETKDGGASWSEIYSHPVAGQFKGAGLIQSVAQFKQSGGRSIVMATSEGLLRSDDDGRTWITLGGIR